MLSQPFLSVIIPCLNDAAALEVLLPALNVHDQVEMIVVSGRDDKAVTEVSVRHGAKCLTIDGPRGLRLRKGAEIAQSPYLWFIHADAGLAPGAVDAVIDSLNNGSTGGFFRFRFTGPRKIQKKIMELSIAIRCHGGGIPYGDQGLFVRASDYTLAGGHAPTPLFEETKLVRWLQRSGQFDALPLSIGVNPGRWDREGYALRIFKNRCLVLGHFLGMSADKLARSYFSKR